MVGFSLMHTHPAFAIAGMLCSVGMMIWLLMAIPYAIIRRNKIRLADAVMIGFAVLVSSAIVIPDNFFAR